MRRDEMRKGDKQRSEGKTNTRGRQGEHKHTKRQRHRLFSSCTTVVLVFVVVFVVVLFFFCGPSSLPKNFIALLGFAFGFFAFSKSSSAA
jgi:hypothetical protein